MANRFGKVTDSYGNPDEINKRNALEEATNFLRQSGCVVDMEYKSITIHQGSLKINSAADFLAKEFGYMVYWNNRKNLVQ